MLTTSSGKHLGDITHAHIVSLKCKLISSAKDSDDLSIGVDRNCDRRGNELTINEYKIGIYHLRIMLKDVLGFAKHQEKATHGLCYKLTLTTKDDAALQRAMAINDARFKVDLIHWYVPHYTPSIQQQGILSKQISSKTPTELRYIEGFDCMEKVKSQTL